MDPVNNRKIEYRASSLTQQRENDNIPWRPSNENSSTYFVAKEKNTSHLE